MTLFFEGDVATVSMVSKIGGCSTNIGIFTRLWKGERLNCLEGTVLMCRIAGVI